MLTCEGDLYHSETNRAGYVNLGTAVNALVEDLISDRLMKVDYLISINLYLYFKQLVISF